MKGSTGRAGGEVAIKLDISKAYDSIEWPFLEAMMIALGFDTRWVNMIMMCVRSVKYSILINDDVVGPIVPSRGLRQGDPLSPYLYILCAEGMSVLLKEAESRSLVTGISIRRNCPSVSHLLFADDSFLFFKATEDQCHVIRHLLSTYERASGQGVNFSKSGVFFSSNVFEVQREILRDILGIHTPINHSRYLGLPSLIGSNKSSIFAFLRNKMWKSINRWKFKFLSKAGKEVLIKSVAKSIPTYCMSVFLLPTSLLDELQKMMNSFWWGSKDDGQRKIHWLRWDRMCGKKSDGGLGFRNLRSFNLAMLAKQGWRVIQQPNSLIGRIFKGRYFASSDLFKAKLGHNPSFTWRSIFQALEVLRKGVRWRVGDGRTIKVWKDPWLPKDNDFGVDTGEEYVGADLRVVDLMSPGGSSWDSDKVRAVFPEEEALRVISLPINPARADRVIWHYEKKGIYSVRSGYHVAYAREAVNNSGPGITWHKVWKANVPPKIKVFLWRALRNILPTRDRINHRGIALEVNCGCGDGAETVDHALLHCRCAAPVWRLWPRWEGAVDNSFADRFGQICDTNDSHVLAEFASLAWAIWWARNQRVWHNSDVAASTVVKKALDFLDDWAHVQAVNNPLTSFQSTSNHAEITRMEWTAEVDAAITQDPVGMGVGVIVRKVDGSFYKAFTSHRQGLFSPRMAEAVALKECLKFVENYTSGAGIVFSDAKGVVQAVRNESADWSEFSDIILDCQISIARRKDVKVAWVRRENNRVAHVLARNAVRYESCKLWPEAPACIALLVVS